MTTRGSERGKPPADEPAMARPSRHPVEWVLSAFAEVRPGEGASALLLALNVFLLLTAYYLLKVVREPLILLGGAFGLEGATLKAAAAAVQAVLLLAVVPAYGFLAGRVTRMKLINTVTAVTLVFLVGFNVLAYLGVAVGFGFFIWVGIFNLLIVAQFWSFANDIYSEEQGRRIFAIVGFGGTTGAIAGAWLGGTLVRARAPTEVMLVAGGVLVAATVITNVVHRANARREAVATPSATAPAAPSTAGAFKLVFRRRYLLLIGLMTVTYNTVNTNGEFILGDTIRARAIAEVTAELPDDLAPDEAAKELEVRAGRIIGDFYGSFFTYVNVLSALIQLFLVSRIFKYLGVRAALFFLPVIAMGSYAAITIIPLLSIIKVGKVLENGTDYSLQNTTRQALFLPTSREAKYKAKAAIDTFFVRFGDVSSFAIIYAVTVLLGVSAVGVAVVNVGLAALWLWLCVGISAQHRGLTAEAQAAPIRTERQESVLQ